MYIFNVYIYIDIYRYIIVCVCVCVCVWYAQIDMLAMNLGSRLSYVIYQYFISFYATAVNS